MRLSSTLLAILLATTAHAGVISTGDNTFPTDPDQFRIGLNGVGSWTIDGGSAVTMRGNPANIGLVPFTVAEPFLIVGRRPGSNGTVLIDGAGSRLDIVAVGSNPAAPNMDGAGAQIGRQGVGSMTLRNGATLTISDTAGPVGSGARSGESVNVGREGGGVGTLKLDASTLSIQGPGAFIQIARDGGHGSTEIVNSSTVILRNLTSGPSDGAAVSVGSAPSVAASGSIGSLLVRDSTVTIDAKDGFAGLFAGRDNSNSTGRVEIRGATARMDILSTSNTGITIGRDATSTGQLLVTDGALVNLGSPASAFLSIGRDAGARGEVTISGGARLDMSAATDSDVTVGAAVIALGRTAGGSGKLDIFGAGAALRVVDQVIIGAPVSLGGGTGDGAVTVRDGGALTARQVLLGAGGTLAGNGTIAASVVVDGGTVTPGTSPGTLHVQGGLKVASGRLHFEIGGIEPGQSDLIEVSGVLELLGGIVEIEFIGGFVPSPSDSITLFDAGGGIVSDGSTSFAFAGLPAGVNLGVTIDPTGQVSVSRALDETEIPAPGGVTLMAIALAMLGARRHAQPAGLSR